jgi:hypothetical protein
MVLRGMVLCYVCYYTVPRVGTLPQPSWKGWCPISPVILLGFLTVTRLERVQRREARGVDGQSRPKFLGLGATVQDDLRIKHLIERKDRYVHQTVTPQLGISETSLLFTRACWTNQR